MVVGVLDGAVRMKRDAARGDSLSVLDLSPTGLNRKVEVYDARKRFRLLLLLGRDYDVERYAIGVAARLKFRYDIFHGIS